MMTMFGLGLEAADTQKMRRVSRWSRQVLPGVGEGEVGMELIGVIILEFLPRSQLTRPCGAIRLPQRLG